MLAFSASTPPRRNRCATGEPYLRARQTPPRSRSWSNQPASTARRAPGPPRRDHVNQPAPPSASALFVARRDRRPATHAELIRISGNSRSQHHSVGQAIGICLAPARLDTLLQQLHALRSQYDHIILDLGAGVGRSVRRMAAWADTLLVLASDEPTILTDAYATLKLHSGPARWRCALGHQPGRRLRRRRTHCRNAGARLHEFPPPAPPRVAGTILRDPRSNSIRRQTLFFSLPATRQARPRPISSGSRRSCEITVSAPYMPYRTGGGDGMS